MSVGPAAGMSLRALFEPRALAVVGASASPQKAGHQLLRTVARFPGPVYPVNPRAQEILGRQAFPDVAAIPDVPDLALIAVPPPVLEGALSDCAEAGVRAAVICTGGLAESGREGALIQLRLSAIAEAAGIAVLGPNTSGFLNPPAHLYASFVSAATSVEAGGLAIVAQSGGINHALAFQAQGEGLGVSLAVGLGNSMRIGFTEVIDYVADLDGVEAIALHIEGVGDGRRMFAAVEAASRRLPVVAAKVGRADIGDFARSHTGALTGSWRVTRSALAQAGAVVVETTTEVIDCARALMATRLTPAKDPGVGLVTGQAGPALALVDRLRSSGVSVPELDGSTRQRLGELMGGDTYQRNPVDTGRPDDSFSQVLATVADDPGVQALGVYQLHEPAAADPSRFLTATQPGRTPIVFATAGPGDEVAPLRESLWQRRVPVYPAPERAADALRALVVDARAAYRRGLSPARPETAVGVAGDGRMLDEHEAKQLLDRAGIATPRRQVCRDRDGAVRTIAGFAGPIVVKLLDPSVQHKSDLGAVHVGVSGPGELDEALAAIDRVATEESRGYLIEELVPPGPELIVGARVDPAFGPLVVLGAGGVGAEVADDVSIRLAPLHRAEAAEMLGELRSARAFEGFRGNVAVDGAALTSLLVSAAEMITSPGEISELEINPLRVTAGGLIALDAVVSAGDRAEWSA